MDKKRNKLITGILFAIISVALLISVNRSGLLTFASLIQHKERLLSMVQQHYMLSVFSFLLLYYISTTFSLPIATVLSLAGGFLFGVVGGMFYNALGATAGATTLFLLSRYLIGDYLQEKYARRLTRINKEFDQHGKYYFLTMRLIPLFPFFLINLVGGLSRIDLKTFFWTTAVGILPGCFVYSLAGSNLSTIMAPEDILSPKVIGSFALLGLLTILPIVWQKIRAQAA